MLSVEYATPKIAKMLEGIGLKHPGIATGLVVPLSQDSKKTDIKATKPEYLGKGARSRVYLFSNAFIDHSKLNTDISREEFYEGRDLILRSGMASNSPFMASIYFKGIKGYEIETFRAADGNFNLEMYNCAVNILTLANERNHLARSSSMNNRMVQDYINNLELAISGYYFGAGAYAQAKSMNPSFVARFAKDFHPQNLNVDHPLLK